MATGDDLYVSDNGQPGTNPDTGLSSDEETTVVSDAGEDFTPNATDSVDFVSPPTDAAASPSLAKMFVVKGAPSVDNGSAPSPRVKSLGASTAYKELLAKSPESAIQAAVIKEVYVKGELRKVVNLGNGTKGAIPTSGKTVSFLDEDGETTKLTDKIVAGEDLLDPSKRDGDTIDPGDTVLDPYTDDSVDDSPDPGAVYRGPSPPPCEPPPFEYSEESTCAPNALAYNPDWTTLSLPYLNGGTCTYGVPLDTDSKCPEGSGLHDLVMGYVPQGISNLMDYLGKQPNAFSNNTLSTYVDESANDITPGSFIQTSAYETSLAPNVNLKVLFKWPFGLIRALRLEDVPSQTELPDGSRTFSVRTEGLFNKIDQLGRQLGVYATQQSQVWGRQQIKLVVEGTNQEINLLKESQAIDSFKASIDRLLSFNDFVLSRNGSTTQGTPFELAESLSVAEEVSFYYTPEYELTKAEARSRAAPFVDLRLGVLGQYPGLKDATLLSYLAQLDSILYDIGRSNPISLTDFVQKYHYPRVQVTDGVSSDLPVFNVFDSGCIGDDLISAGNSILDGVEGLGALFLDKFADYVCMTDEQLAERNRQIRDSADEFKSLIESEAAGILPMGDPLVQAVVRGIENISENGPTIATAWEKLFNKMSMCGLLSLFAKTVEFVAKNDVCGITPEKAIYSAIRGAFKEMDLKDFQRVFDGLPDEIRPLIQEKYAARMAEFLRDIGYTAGLSFPWDMEQRQQRQTEEEELGLLLYTADVFEAPNSPLPTEYSGSLATAFLQGYQHLAHAPPSGSFAEEWSAAYWDGYVQNERDLASDPTGMSPSYDAEVGEYTLSDSQQQALVNNVQITLNRQNGASVGKLVANLLNDTIEFAVESLVGAIMETFEENLTLDQVVELLKDVPVIGAILKVLPRIGKCVINGNIKKDGQVINFSELQNNLFKGGEIDICNLKAAKKPIVLPNMELIMQLKVNTLWASAQNAIIEVLKQALISILLRTLFGILRKAIETILGFVCAATQGNTDAFLRGTLPPGLLAAGDMRSFLQGALCSNNPQSVDADAELSRLAASLLPGVSESDALSLLGPQGDCNFIDRIQTALTAQQLLDLIEGTADEYTVAAVMRIIEFDCSDLQAVLPNEAAVVSFFQNLGTVFPQEYIDSLRELLATSDIANGIPELDPDNCPPLDEALDNLREALNCEGLSTPSQIDAYVEAFQDRLMSTVEDMAAGLGGGLESNLTDTIQDTLQELLPKDEPGNLLIAEDIVSVLFDPLYGFYGRDLMHPIGVPFSPAFPNNGGLVNMILANKNGVAQTGQIANYALAVTTLTGPIMAFVSLLPPPANFMATQGAMASLGTNLRQTFFGIEPDESYYDTTPCNDEIPVSREAFIEYVNATPSSERDALDLPTDPYSSAADEDFNAWRRNQRADRAACRQRNAIATAAGFGRGPYGHGPLKKPMTIAKSLQEIFLNMEEYSSTEGETMTAFLPMSETLDGYIFADTDRYSPRATFFEMRYDFQRGRLEFIPYESISDGARYIRPTENPDERLTIESTNNARLQLELAEYLDTLPVVGPTPFTRTPTSVGGAVLLQNIKNFMPTEAAWTAPDPTSAVDADEAARIAEIAAQEPFWLEDTTTIVSRSRRGVLSQMASSVGNNSEAFKYGNYNLDVLTDEDVLNPSDEILDKGYNFMYLDDGQIFVEPPPQGGWLEIKDRLMPRMSETFCCPDRKELFDIQSIKDRTLDAYKIADDDPRLSLDPKTVNEPPYAKILSRMNLAACEGVIIATIRTYVVEYFIKGYATFNKFSPRAPEVHSDILAEYITQRMKKGLFNQHNEPGAPVWPPGLPVGFPIIPPDTDPAVPEGVKAEKLHAYWYEFLEQCVQSYSRRIKAGSSPVTGEINNAMTELQSALESYRKPDTAELNSIRASMFAIFSLIPPLLPFIPIVLPQITKKSFERKAKVDLLREYEPQALIILKQLVKEELNRVADEIPDIFAPPPGDRIDNVYMEFLNQTFSLGDRNIFNIPIVRGAEDVVTHILPSYMEPLPLGFVADAERLEGDEFLLEAYIRGTRNDAGREALELNSWRDGEVYSFEDVVSIFESSDIDYVISDVFDSFNYGLRLVLVPSTETVSRCPTLFEKMRTPESSNNNEGLFAHPPRFLGGEVEFGEFTLPIVFSEMLEAPYLGQITNFVSAVRAGADSFNSRDNGVFKWNDLAAIMTQMDEFRTLFEYSIPLNTVVSFLGIYNAESMLECIGNQDDWKPDRGLPRPFKRWNRRTFPALKRNLKKQFKEIYNSNDFTYIEQDRDSASREEVDRLRERFDINPWKFPDITPPVQSRLVYTNPMCYSDETMTEGTAPGAPGEVPPYTGPPKPEDEDVRIIEEKAPEIPAVERGLPAKDYGADIDVVIEREMELVELEDLLAEVGELAALDFGGYELIERIRTGILFENPADLPFDIVDIIAQWTDPRRWPDSDGGGPGRSRAPDSDGDGIPDKDDPVPLTALGERLSDIGVTLREDVDLEFVLDIITITARFGEMTDAAIEAWGMYHGFGDAPEAFAAAVNELLDAAENPEVAVLLSATSQALFELSNGTLSLIV